MSATLHCYGLRYRPLDIGTAPKGHVRLDPAWTPDYGAALSRHGVVVFDRKLTPEEVRQFELVPELDDEDKAALLQACSQDLGEYAQGYVEMVDDGDRAYFDTAVLQAVANHYPTGCYLGPTGLTKFTDRVLDAIRQIAEQATHTPTA